MKWNNKNKVRHHREVDPPRRRGPLAIQRPPRRGSTPAVEMGTARVEAIARRIRQKLGLNDFQPLPHDRALALIPNLTIHPFSTLPIKQRHIDHARTAGYREWSGLAHTMPDGSRHIVFNDAHKLAATRVTLLEEFFHLYLGHPTEIVRQYPGLGTHRTYDNTKEKEAYRCAIAALVPYRGFERKLIKGTHLRRIEEYYNVPISAVEDRISMTGLGALSNGAIKQIRFPV